MNAEELFVTGAIVSAALWLISRIWLRARDRYRKGPCCGEGCGCAGPAIFGPKGKKVRGKSRE